MAKSGLWLRGATGKLAGVVCQKGVIDLSGKRGTLLRELVTPSNPKTAEQAEQRRKLNPIAKIFTAFRGVLDNSFEAYSAGTLSWLKYLSVNLKSANIPYVVKGTSSAVPGEYVMSEGSAKPTSQTFDTEGHTATINVGQSNDALNNFASNVTAYNALDADARAEADGIALRQAIVDEAKACIGTSNDCQLTYAIVYQTEEEWTNTSSFKFETTYGRDIFAMYDNKGNLYTQSFLATSGDVDAFAITAQSVADGKNADSSTLHICGMATIYSEQTENGWIKSSQTMEIIDDDEIKDFLYGTVAVEETIASYMDESAMANSQYTESKQ